MNSNEDKIIADGLSLVREGILNSDWQKVCDGYNSISGEELQPQAKPKSRLENIRSLIESKKNKIVIENTDTLDQINTTNWAKLNKSQVLEKLKELGIDTTPIKDKSKKELVVIGKNTEEPQVRPVIKEQTNGPRIITDGYDEVEARHNAALAKKKVKIPAVRSQPPRDNSKEEGDVAVRYYDHPEKLPPWK